MTAEIAILNRNAVALAADSAVTISQPSGPKIYNTANKLFMLSKFHPVGIMVYGSADLMTVPWETIIKAYRVDLGSRTLDTVTDYAQDFFSFFEKANPLFPTSMQASLFQGYISGYLTDIKDEINNSIKLQLQTSGALSQADVTSSVQQIIDRRWDEWERYRRLENFTQADEEELTAVYGPQIASAISSVLELLPIDAVLDKLTRMCSFTVSRDRYWFFESGVVIAGFGQSEMFPSVLCYSIERVVNNKLKYKFNEERSSSIAFDEQVASIVPFAQSEMVSRFIEGIDPDYARFFRSYLNQLLVKDYPQTISEKLTDKLSAPELDTLRKKFGNLGERLVETFETQEMRFKDAFFISPIINIVAVLPKDELAAMAESFVNLTSFKRRMSAEQETVGGPIDVAVISKGDGFVWIKRKHYFDKDLNPGFFANYYRKDEGAHAENRISEKSGKQTSKRTATKSKRRR